MSNQEKISLYVADRLWDCIPDLKEHARELKAVGCKEGYKGVCEIISQLEQLGDWLCDHPGK